MRERTVVHESPCHHSDDWKDILIRYHSIQYMYHKYPSIESINQSINQLKLPLSYYQICNSPKLSTEIIC